MTVKIPSLFDKKDIHEFFDEFIKLNAQRRGFSQRSLSQKVGWPISYLPDLMKRRKSFTVKRAVEFGKYARLSPIDFEKLIYLAILDSGHIDVSDMQKITGTNLSERKGASKDLELLSVTNFLVFEVIRWLHGSATLEILCEIASKKEISVSSVRLAISLLSKKNFIEKRGKRYCVLRDSLISDDKDALYGKESHQQFMELQAKYFRDPFGPAVYNSAIVHIERSRFDNLADRIVALRNWIFEVSRTDSEQPLEADVRLFQLDMNLIPLFDREFCKKIRNC